ncbi:MAG: PKD domain-containing protein [Nanoarchaeota archaeon]
MKKGLIFIGVLLSIIYFFSFVEAATFSYGGNNILRSYVGGELISGTLNMSLKGESATSLLTSNFEGSISLIDFLKKNDLIEGQDYACNFKNCADAYKVGSTMTSLSLVNNERKAIGFKITGSDVRINSMKLSLSSDVGPSCSKEFELNIANDTKNVQSYKYLNETCGEPKHGCFDTSLRDNNWAGITSSTYCEKMLMPTAPAFQVGARIKDKTSGTSDLKIEIYDSDWNFVGDCILPKNTQNIQDVSCIIPFANTEEKNIYVCIHSENGNADYQINFETESPICGNIGTYFEDYGGDYDLFAVPLKFDSLNFEINETTYQDLTGEFLSAVVDNYIDNVYNRNCTSSLGCVVPIDLIVNKQQTISITNANINYDISVANSVSNGNVYALDKANATISSVYLNLNVEKAGLGLPVTTSDKTLRLYLNGVGIFPGFAINVTPGFVFDIAPKNALVGIDTSFEVLTSVNVSSVKWSFGDGSADMTTQTKRVSHKYMQEGDFELIVEVTKNNGVTVRKTFIIFSGNIQTAVENLISKSDKLLGNLSTQMSSFDPWVKNALNNKINLTEINLSLNGIKAKISAGGDYSYSEALDELLALDLPKEIIINSQGRDIPLDVGFNNIDSSYVELLSGDETSLTDSQRSDLLQKIINWNYDYYSSKVEYKVISKKSDSEIAPIFTYFKIVLTGKNGAQKSGNLIIDYPKDEIVFKDNYGQISLDSESGSATSIAISNGLTIELLLPAKIQVSELGAYVAPPLNELVNDSGYIPPECPDCKPKKISVWLYIILVIVFLVIYIILQEWYKKRYESFLFKNRDDLYNIINFIFNSRITGLSDNEIRKKLSSNNWKLEQISYSFKKIDGKRTGMWEIPIFKFLENRRVKKEIALRKEQNQVNGRFIKRPY